MKTIRPSLLKRKITLKQINKRQHGKPKEEKTKTTENIKLRAKIVEHQRQQNNHIMAIDANCFKLRVVEKSNSQF